MTTRKRRTEGSRTIPHQAAKSRPKALVKLNVRGLVEATREFDDEFIADSFEEPTAAQKAHLRRARRNRGRPKGGKGLK